MNFPFSFAIAFAPFRFALRVVVVVGILSISSGFSKAEESPSPDRVLSPYFWVKPTALGQDCPAADQPDPLPLKSTQVEAEIAGVFANVKVTQHYLNAGKIPLEAIYIFPGSTRAAVHGLTLKVGDRVIEAKTKERGAAKQIYEAAKAAGKTASLLEQQRPNVFQMNVANILPGDEVTVELRYIEMLVPDAGIYEFVYPGVVGPRYSNRPEKGASPENAWVANPYLHKGQSDPAAFQLRVNLQSPVPVTELACKTHATKIEYADEKSARIELQNTAGSDRDFILRFRLSGAAIQSGLVVSESEKEKFFLLAIEPPQRVAPAQIPPREFDFIVDVSGSMAGFPLNTAKQLAHQLLGTLRPTDSFNILVFSGGNQVFAPQAVPATTQNIQSALQLLDTQNGGGATELLPALRAALEMPHRDETSRTFLVITDGYVDVENEAFEFVRGHLGQANLFAFGIGSSVNRHLIEGLARAGQGEPFIVTDPEAAAETASRLRRYVDSPVLTRAAVSFPGVDVYDVEPLSLPDLLAERPLLVFGKWRGKGEGQAVVTGISGAGPYRSAHDFALATHLADADGLASLWARKRIARLSDDFELNATDERKAEVTNLGLTYNLLTRFTSFIAVDDVVRRTSPTLKTIQQPVPLPAGVEESAVGGGMVGAAPEPGTFLLAGVAGLFALIACRRKRKKPEHSLENDRSV